jgi:hypothetical protein
VGEAEGRASLEPSLAGLGASLQSRHRGWTFAIGAAFGVAWVDMRGERPSSGFSVRSDRVTAAAGFGELALSKTLVDGLRLRSELWFGSTVPRVAIRFADREVATWGRPFAVATLALELAVPGLTR